MTVFNSNEVLLAKTWKVSINSLKAKTKTN